MTRSVRIGAWGMRWMSDIAVSLAQAMRLPLRPVSLRGGKAWLARRWRGCLEVPAPQAWVGAVSGSRVERRWRRDEARAFAPASRERVAFLCPCKEKVTQRKHALRPRPTRCAHRVHSAGAFRRDIHVSSKNDVLARFAIESGAGAARRLPVRRGEAVLRLFPPNPCTSSSGSLPAAPSLRKGAGKINGHSNGKVTSRSRFDHVGWACASA